MRLPRPRRSSCSPTTPSAGPPSSSAGRRACSTRRWRLSSTGSRSSSRRRRLERRAAAALFLVEVPYADGRGCKREQEPEVALVRQRQEQRCGQVGEQGEKEAGGEPRQARVADGTRAFSNAKQRPLRQDDQREEHADAEGADLCREPQVEIVGLARGNRALVGAELHRVVDLSADSSRVLLVIERELAG